MLSFIRRPWRDNALDSRAAERCFLSSVELSLEYCSRLCGSACRRAGLGTIGAARCNNVFSFSMLVSAKSPVERSGPRASTQRCERKEQPADLEYDRSYEARSSLERVADGEVEERRAAIRHRTPRRAGT